MSASEPNTATGRIKRNVHEKRQRHTAGHLLAEESCLLRQNLIGRVVNHHSAHTTHIYRRHQWMTSLIQRREALRRPRRAQVMARALHAFVMPVVVSRDIEVRHAGCLQARMRPLDGGFRGKAQDVAHQHQQCHALFAGTRQCLLETRLRCRRRAGRHMLRRIVGFRHPSAVGLIRFTARIIQKEMRIADHHDLQRRTHRRAEDPQTFRIKREPAPQTARGRLRRGCGRAFAADNGRRSGDRRHLQKTSTRNRHKAPPKS